MNVAYPEMGIRIKIPFVFSFSMSVAIKFIILLKFMNSMISGASGYL